ncbi:DUF87 domain-containing protein [Aerococcaceae bacterium zg-ZJ1578]|uniref:FtsK/SpoIIIE domain-containing protein n=1 Tax=Aerococcaceae bacterium zg-252 TaxID=2796928 RepID=UPI001A2378EA|nr:DUF87 domain-containing protein [Aerococcaceae bacterium zg-1578]MBR7928485.1 DUF87 domain-containing protein [Aerococcaceae bacterium zg-ZUI334]
MSKIYERNQFGNYEYRYRYFNLWTLILIEFVMFIMFAFMYVLFDVFLFLMIFSAILFCLTLYLKLYLRNKIIEKSITRSHYFKERAFTEKLERALLDTANLNLMKYAIEIEVPAVAVRFRTSDVLELTIERLAGMEIDKLANIINAVANYGIFKKFIVEEAIESSDGTEFRFTMINLDTIQSMIIKNFDDYGTDKYQIKLNEQYNWNIVDSPHALICGRTGTGKSTFLFYLIQSALLRGWELHIVDFKIEFEFLKSIIGKDNIVQSTDMIFDKLDYLINVMTIRHAIISNAVIERQKIGLTGADLNLRPIFLIIDEVGSLVASLESKQKKLFNEKLLQLIQKGRSALVNVILATQQANAEVVTTSIREQTTFKLLLGSSNHLERAMVFGSKTDNMTDAVANFEGYLSTTRAISGAKLYKIPNLYSNGFEGIDVFYKCYQMGIDVLYQNIE